MARWRLRPAIGVEVCRRERFWVVHVRVEGQGGPFLDQPNTGMAVPVDAALVPPG